MDLIPILVGALIGGVFILGVELVGRFRARREKLRATQAVTPLDKKVELVATLSGELGRLNAEIADEFRLQRAEVDRLAAEADHARKVAEVNQEALDAANTVANRQLSALLDTRAKSDRRFQIAVAVISFGAGVLATFAIQWAASLNA